MIQCVIAQTNARSIARKCDTVSRNNVKLTHLHPETH